MSISPRFAYVQARIQARYAERPSLATWFGLDQINEFGRYLQQANATGLSRWLEKLGVSSSTHAVEISLREGFRNHIGEVAKWMPDSWYDAITWYSILIDMEPIRCIASGEARPDWMADDPFLRSLIETPLGWPLSVLMDNTGDGEQLAANWRTIWRHHWPQMRSEESQGLETLAQSLPVASYSRLLVERLAQNFRRHSGRPVAVFSYLGLVLTDLLRLRGELLRRIKFVGEFVGQAE